EGDVPRLVGAPRALLRGSRLAGDRDGEAREHLHRGTARLAGRAAKTLEDGLPELRPDVQMPRGGRLQLLDGLAGGVLDPLADPRGQDVPAVGDRRVGHGHLERVGLEVALANGEVDVVA